MISDEELELLLDRRPEVFADRQKGWTSAGPAGQTAAKKGAEQGGRAAAFAVYDGPATQGNDLLAEMLAKGEQDDE